MSLFKPFLAGSHLLSPLLHLQGHVNTNTSLSPFPGLAFIHLLHEENPLFLLIKFPQLKLMMLDDSFYAVLLWLLDPVAGPQALH